MKASSLGLAGSALAYLASSCLAQTVTVRVINGKNGHPLAKQGVVLSLLYDGAAKAPPDYPGPVNLETDDQGEAHFKLPQPPPAHLAATVRIDLSRWRCVCSLLSTTDEVVQSGVVKVESGGKGPSRPKPLEILFVARPLSLLYRILGPFEKD